MGNDGLPGQLLGDIIASKSNKLQGFTLCTRKSSEMPVLVGFGAIEEGMKLSLLLNREAVFMPEASILKLGLISLKH